MSDDRKMQLGVHSGWSPWQPRTRREHAPYDEELNRTPQHWDAVRKPYFRFHERVEIRRRYRSGPRPWAPGRYCTSAWQPWSGFGRFSDLRTIMRGKYYAARYTGEHVTPEHYTLRHHGQEAYDRDMASSRAKRSWTP